MNTSATRSLSVVEVQCRQPTTNTSASTQCRQPTTNTKKWPLIH